MRSKVWYTFNCPKCGEIHLRLDPVEDNLQKQPCNKCGEEAKRKYILGGINFKGPGFHINDYK